MCMEAKQPDDNGTTLEEEVGKHRVCQIPIRQVCLLQRTVHVCPVHRRFHPIRSRRSGTEKIIQEIQDAGLGITDEGDIADFLGVHIERKDNEFHLTQPKLIDSILEDLHLEGDKVHIKDTPMASSKLLSRHLDSPDFDHHFQY